MSSAPTVSLSVEYLHAIPIGGDYTALGEVVRIGRAMAIVDARILSDDDTVLARGTCIYQIPRPK
ncbi:MAG: PaaI family thioesterase [Acidimicrobiales bacterium]|nr:PaaI family thioesterase [Acidimicrobiales bacterium]